MKLKILLLFSFVCLYVKALEDSPQSVYVVTWNVGSGDPPDSVKLFSGQISDERALNPDIVVVGLQEVTMNPLKAAANSIRGGGKWSTTIDDLLTSRNEYHKVDSESLQGLYVAVYVKIKYKDTIKEKKTHTVMTGMGGLTANKGGVILKFKQNNQQYCIVNSHLAAHDDKLKERIDDYKKINEERVKSCNPKSDYVFWLGDLNFRIDEKLTREEILKLINSNKLDQLLEKDQLTVNKKSKQIFSDFTEEKITFPPTFKLEKGKGTYNSERRPAWTDRVLYKSDTGKTITTALYHSLTIYKQSDHYPVFAQFHLQ